MAAEPGQISYLCLRSEQAATRIGANSRHFVIGNYKRLWPLDDDRKLVDVYPETLSNTSVLEERALHANRNRLEGEEFDHVLLPYVCCTTSTHTM